jgi:hypothetical protein
VNKSPVIQPQGKHSNKLKKKVIFFPQNGIPTKLMNQNIRQFPNKTVTATVKQISFTITLSLQQYSATKAPKHRTVIATV